MTGAALFPRGRTSRTPAAFYPAVGFTEMHGDEKTDALYSPMRSRFSSSIARANGYVYDGYFRAEQKLLFELLDPGAAVVLDACCGSGLMLMPRSDGDHLVFGVDFNDAACIAARANGFRIVRGDAFRLPLPDSSVDEIVNCQFFNQQTPEQVRGFIGEAFRVLKPGGRLILVWRNGAAWIHRAAHFLLTWRDRFLGQPLFPQYTHDIGAVEAIIQQSGGETEYAGVQFAPLSWQSVKLNSFMARCIGASNVTVGRKTARPEARTGSD